MTEILVWSKLGQTWGQRIGLVLTQGPPGTPFLVSGSQLCFAFSVSGLWVGGTVGTSNKDSRVSLPAPHYPGLQTWRSNVARDWTCLAVGGAWRGPRGW